MEISADNDLFDRQRESHGLYNLTVGHRRIFGPLRGCHSDYAITAPGDPPDVPEAEDIKPVASDHVVATGAQLHRLLKAKKISHLLYADLATNECVRFRDYGMKNMRRMGYDTILLRDCTTVIENAYTVASEEMTKFSILDIERNFATTTVASLISACEQLD